MIDRQRVSTNLFANMGALSSRPDEAFSPMEVDSDALTADDLPDHTARATPLRALAAMGPMDAYLGSSPTPHTRKSIQNVVSEDTDVATPTAVRNIHYAANDEPASSPPGFQRNTQFDTAENDSTVLVGSSFEYRQTESNRSMSFDEGTTIDEEALLEAVAHHENPQIDAEPPSDSIMSELPSSTIDLQLTAQIDADMQAHDDAATEETEVATSQSQNSFVDAASQQQLSMRDSDRADSYAELENTQTPTRASTRRASRKNSQAGTSSTSRVDDSFTALSSQDTPNSLRRSTRHSTGIPPLPPSTKKPRHPPGKKDNKANKGRDAPEKHKSGEHHTELHSQVTKQPNGEERLDNIVVAASATPKNTRGKKRKSMSSNAMPESNAATPQSNRKLNLRRSHSTLSQVENSEDLTVDDTPAPKRAKQDNHQDVSEAREKIPSSQTKRLSHVQVSPRPLSRSSNTTSPTPENPSITLPDHAGTEAIVPATQPEPSLGSELVQDTMPSSPSSSQLPQLKTPSRSFAERVILTPRSIINQLKSLKDYIFNTPQLVFSREEEREVSDAVFHIQRGVFTAGLKAREEQERQQHERQLGEE